MSGTNVERLDWTILLTKPEQPGLRQASPSLPYTLKFTGNQPKSSSPETPRKSWSVEPPASIASESTSLI